MRTGELEGVLECVWYWENEDGLKVKLHYAFSFFVYCNSKPFYLLAFLNLVAALNIVPNELINNHEVLSFLKTWLHYNVLPELLLRLL